MRIAISITTHNRYEVFKKTLEQIIKFKPVNAEIFIVDDGSAEPVKEATFRFETAQGIAAAKNKCFELADGYDYHFAFDDDTYPIKEDWHLEYIKTGLNHLCFTFDKFSNGKPNGRVQIGKKDNIILYKEPCGCMNFYTKACFDAVGGMDIAFGRWSYEHVHHSMRIHNAGLTPSPFMDIENSLELFYSYDWDQTTTRSVDPKIRAQLARTNERKYRQEIKSKAFIPYKQQKNLVLTCYFTTLIDPQRGTKWQYDGGATNALYWSVPNGVDFRCLYDHSKIFELPMVSYKPKHDNPYMAKWIAFLDYIIAHPEYDNIFMLDGTDTEVLVNPFPHIDRSMLYAGDENGTLNNQWLKNHHPNYLSFIDRNKYKKIYNSGILGGNRDIVLEFLNEMCNTIKNDNSLTDMSAFNYTLHELFKDRVVSGRKVNTVFKSFDKVNKLGSWIKHK